MWDDPGSLRLTVLAGSTDARIRSLLESGELSDCIVLWEARQDEARTALHLLLVHGETVVEA